jgi:3-oxoacyl-[acyl-carrier-protein] synthase II
VITGAGLITALGASSAEFFDTLCAGRSALKTVRLQPEYEHLLPTAHAGQIPSFSPQEYLGEGNLRPLDRPAQLLAAAAGNALQASGWAPGMLAECEVGIVIGTFFSGVRTIADFDRRALREGPCYASPMDFANTVLNAAGGQTAIRHNLRGINTTVAGGAASGLQAIAYACDLIRSGRARALLAGGFEEISFESLHAFARAGLLSGATGAARDFPVPFDVRRTGIALGEGAVLLMLEGAEAVAHRGTLPLAEIKGYGQGFDPSRGHSDASAVAAVMRAMQLALRDADLTPEGIHCVSASANGSIRGDRHEALALEDVFARGGLRPAITAIKSLLGESLGATGAMQTLALVESLRTGLVPGIRGLEDAETEFVRENASSHTRDLALRTGLVNSVALDGNCCSVVLESCQAA